MKKSTLHFLRLTLIISHNIPVIPGGRVISGIFEYFFKNLKCDVTTKIFNYEISLDPSESVERELLFAPQLFDWREIRFLAEALNPGSLFLDLGSNIGGYSLALSHIVGKNGCIVAVDADPYSFENLCRTINLNNISQIIPVNKGIWSSDRDFHFEPQLYGNRGGGRMVLNSTDTSIQISCMSLKNLLNDTLGSFEKIAALKIDVEGSEYEVLKSFFEDVEKDKWPTRMIVERSPDNITKNICKDVNPLLKSLGYKINFQHGINYAWEKN
ncbi:FkbM family methyltransferase [Polynucleobacter sp. MWH-UH24A]|uniref:FkbM family methyltransferase n=1 Tax=Polynucleobacter sp. MWH-UH24A TaxID=2689110 RepID=UPI001BFD7331|nr:FkbM family methyltransferase [Polynucleobacter sp. MWH-UH24A]QWD76427.1 FkbM family methyltransferase [Polynucleobacter sp. MWH-UH24A]